MKFKEIAFKDKNSKRIYLDYMARVQQASKSLNKTNQQEIVLELNSHIYESLIHDPATEHAEVERLLDIIEKMGRPEVFLKPLVAEKKLEEATTTFNPINVVKALVLNIGNGISYVLFTILYLLLFGFLFLVIAKIADPQHVGLYYHANNFFALGSYRNNGISPVAYERLGNWFIPTMLFAAAVFYILITLLLRLKRTSKSYHMTKKYLTTIVLLFVSSFTFAQQLDTKKLDAYFNSLEQHDKFMGSLAISQNGKILYSKTIGFADVANKCKATATTTYRIGSISKTFTAVLVFKAIAQQKLALDQTIGKFFPSIKNADKITIGQLLSHRSGIADFTDDEDFDTWRTEAKSQKEMVNLIAKAGNDFKPDSTAAYSNSNYVLLTYILAQTLKKPYAELLETYITKPLGLTHTYLGKKINTANNESKSYSFVKGWQLEPETDISIPLGAGGIVSTPTDLLKFSDALFNGKLVTKAQLELMKTIKDGHGMGLFQIPFYEHIAYGHRGGIDKFRAVFSHDPAAKLSFALISNASNYNNNEIPIAVLSVAYNKPFDFPDFNTQQVAATDLDKYLGVYASSQIPIKITITKENNTLVAAATGQSAIQLQAKEKDSFTFDKTGIVLEFDTSTHTMMLKQGGGAFKFTKE